VHSLGKYEELKDTANVNAVKILWSTGVLQFPLYSAKQHTSQVDIGYFHQNDLNSIEGIVFRIKAGPANRVVV